MSRRHVPFCNLFADGSLVLALTAGFGIAALLAAHLGWGLPLGPTWPALVQIHGNVQVYGWLGLFIMGVSLHFLPRFAGRPLRWSRGPVVVAVLMVAGLVLRAAGQGLSLAGGSSSLAMRAGALLHVLGAAAGVLLLIDVVAHAAPERGPIRALRLCLGAALAGWLLSSAASAWAVHLAGTPGRLADPGWSRFGLDLFVDGVLIPVALAFSVRTFPLYLRLPAVRWSVDGLVAVYLVGAAAQAVVRLLTLGPSGADGLGPLAAAGSLTKGVALLVFVWRIDLLTRRLAPWTAERCGEPPAEPVRHERPRPHLPDYGEFGHFEWHLLAAYLFLGLGGGIEALSGINRLLGLALPVTEDAIRHTYLSGFGTLLLLGMAPRMLPGFWGIRRPASSLLVDLSALCGIASALLRVGVGLLPSAWSAPGWRTVAGLSGLLGWLAVACLAVNLWRTRWTRPTAA